MIIDGKTTVLGIMGWPITHTHSPSMHNRAAHALGLNLAYVPLPVHPAHVADAVRGIAALGFRGVNVTVPHKQAVIPYLDRLDPAAQALGAVNTIVVNREDNNVELVGHNTDWIGFIDDLWAHEVDIQGRFCTVLGAGGSARAIVYALAMAGALVTIYARRIEQAQALIQDLSPHLPDSFLVAHSFAALSKSSEQGHLIVNTTPLGMTPHEGYSVWPNDIPLNPRAFVYDLVYNPATTQLMQQARKAGCRTANGRGMLLRQGVAAFELWTGQKPELDMMDG